MDIVITHPSIIWIIKKLTGTNMPLLFLPVLKALGFSEAPDDSEEKLFNSYWSLIHSLPQLFLA
jgi:hypothetical protein